MKELLQELETARNQFENAEPEYIEAACYKLKAAEMALKAFFMKERKVYNDRA